MLGQRGCLVGPPLATPLVSDMDVDVIRPSLASNTTSDTNRVQLESFPLIHPEAAARHTQFLDQQVGALDRISSEGTSYLQPCWLLSLVRLGGGLKLSLPLWLPVGPETVSVKNFSWGRTPQHLPSLSTLKNLSHF